LTFFEGYITLDLDSAEVFRGIDIFCRFFAFKDFLSYRPLKIVWADRPTAVRFRVNQSYSSYSRSLFVFIYILLLSAHVYQPFYKLLSSGLAFKTASQIYSILQQQSITFGLSLNND
jgi:hypothetical protein